MATNDQTFEYHCKKIHNALQKQNYPIAHFLASKTKHDLDQIKDTYKRMYGQDLVMSLQNAAVSPDLCSVLATWMLCPLERDAIVLRKALDERQREVNYKALLEIFVGTKSSHMVMIKQVYHDKFRRYLDQDIACIEPPHPYQKILMALGASHKAHHVDVSQHIAKCDAKRLFQTGEGNSSAIDEAVLLEILSKRSISQLNLTFSCYKCIYGHNYIKALKKGNRTEFKDALRVVVKCIYNPPKYYAKALYESMKGKVINKDDMARMIMRRAEIDMDEIKRIFKNIYETELGNAISDSIQEEDCKDFLVAIVSKSSNALSTI